MIYGKIGVPEIDVQSHCKWGSGGVAGVRIRVQASVILSGSTAISLSMRAIICREVNSEMRNS